MEVRGLKADLCRAYYRFVIAKGGGPSLLGRDWLRKIKLDWHEIKYAHTTEDILQRYSDVFREELGTLKGVTVKLHVDPDAAPRFFKPRVVPYAMKSKVEEELERLQGIGICGACPVFKVGSAHCSCFESRWNRKDLWRLQADRESSLKADRVSVATGGRPVCNSGWR